MEENKLLIVEKIQHKVLYMSLVSNSWLRSVYVTMTTEHGWRKYNLSVGEYCSKTQPQRRGIRQCRVSNKPCKDLQACENFTSAKNGGFEQASILQNLQAFQN